MADIAIKYEVSPTACAGGGHYQLAATVTGLGPDRVVSLDIPVLENQPSAERLRDALDVITWLIFSKYFADAKHATVKDAITNHQIVLDPQVIP